MKKFIFGLKRWLILFLLFIFLFGDKNIVSADTSELSKNIVDGIYAVTRLTNGSEHYYYLDIYKMGDTTVYCIEPGVDITENIYYNTLDYSSLPYSSDIINYIQKVAFFGYDYFNHQTKEYYMAAQELIWEALGNDVYWSYTFDHSGEINISSQKSDIKSLIIKNGKLSFDNIKLNVHNYDKEITYYNPELFRYEIVNSTLSNVYLDGNNLIINNDGNLDGETITFRYKNYSSVSPLLVYNGNSQKMFSGGYIPFDEYKVTLHVNNGNLTVYKYDSETESIELSGNGSLEGAVYELYNYDNSKIGDFITDVNGEIFIDNLQYGTYYLKEKVSSYGYKLDDNIYTIEINDKDNSFVVYEEPINGKIEIYKTYGEDNIYEEDVIFDIYVNDDLYQSITTDKKGYASIELPFGDYIVKQRTGIDGYKIVDDFKVNIDGSKDIYSYTLNDSKIDVPKEVYFEDIVNPKTGDNIKIYIGSMLGSIIFLIVNLILFKNNSYIGNFKYVFKKR